MKSAGKAFMTRQAQKIAVKATQNMLAEHYDMIRCEAFKQNINDIARQITAVNIASQAMNGKEPEQIRKEYEQFLEVLNFPEFFGKKLNTSVAEKKCEELGIDLNRIKIEVEMIDND